MNDQHFQTLYAQLNPQQKEAVDNIEGPLMVLAGPGTGKTQIIAMRIANILRQTQMEPHNILCLTFTESGVVAMRKRLLQIIGTAAYHVRIHTFHSFCNEVIREHPEEFLFSRELEALTDIERLQLFQKLIDELSGTSPLKPFGAPYFYLNSLISAIQDLKRENINPQELSQKLELSKNFLKEHEATFEEFISTHARQITEEHIQALPNFPIKEAYSPTDSKARTKFKNDTKKWWNSLKSQLPKQQELAEIYQNYQAKLKAKGRYDYEDMVLFVVQKFQENPSLLAHYQEQFQYILVDEYQDTNGAQNEVVRLLASFYQNPNLFVVGDDKQSIYRFQGASLENILYFHELYKKDLKLVSLKENYRSTQNILDASQALIDQNKHNLLAKLPSTKQNLNSNSQNQNIQIQIQEYGHTREENYALAKQIQSLIKAGTKPSEIALLYRRHRDILDVMDLFLKLEIPFRLEAGFNILEDPQINQLITLLKFLHEPHNEQRLFHTLHFDFLNFDRLAIAKLTRAAHDQRSSLFTLITESELGEPFRPFMENTLKWQHKLENSTFTQAFDTILQESNFLNHLTQQPDKLEALNRLNSLYDQFKQWNRNQHELTLTQVLEHLKLLQDNNLALKEHELQTQKDAVRLMTAHKSKGLEFEQVFIIKCVDKTWGNPRKIQILKLPDGLLKKDTQAHQINEDERRLFYVAMTRAKKQVTLSYSNKNEQDRDQVPSLFLQEIPEQLTSKVLTNLETEAQNHLELLFQTPPAQDYSQAEKDYVKSLLQDYKLSVTHLNNYLKCPKLFFYRNILRVPSAKNKHMAFGTAIHEALKDFSLEHKHTGLPSQDFLVQRFERHLKREVLSQQEFRGSLDLGTQELQDYYNHYQNSFQANTLPEYDFKSHGVNLNGIPLTGKLDKIEILNEEQKTVNVVDYKTGNPDSKSKDLKPGGDYHRQIAFYKLLCDLSPQFPYEMVSGEIDFIQRSKKENTFKRAHITLSPEDLERTKTEIQSVYEDIQSLAFLNQDEFSTCGECEYCK